MCEGFSTVSLRLTPWLSETHFGSLGTMAASGMLRLADSGWLAVRGPWATGSWHSFSWKSFFRIETERQLYPPAKSVGLTQPSTQQEAVNADGQVSLHDVIGAHSDKSNAKALRFKALDTSSSVTVEHVRSDCLSLTISCD